jgi:pyruvate formate lyase activating enzyme
MKIDLKSFSYKEYRRLDGNLDAVLETIQTAHGMWIWLERVTLPILGYNNSDAELSKIVEFMMGVSKDIPWHVKAFHPGYKMTDRKRTPVGNLLRGYQHGKNTGLNFVYAGNLPGKVQNAENTFCPYWQRTLIERVGYRVVSNHVKEGHCLGCQNLIPGRWIKSS